MGLFSALFKEETLEESRAKLYKQFPHIGLEVAATKAYEEGWKLGAGNGYSLEACHEVAAINVIVRLFEAVSSGQQLPISQMTEVARWEVLPFLKLPHRNGKKALIQYVIWRQYPERANMEVLLAAIEHLVQHLKSTGNEELLDGIRHGKALSWLPWKNLGSLAA